VRSLGLWLYELAEMWLEYLAVGAAAIPAGIVYVALLKNGAAANLAGAVGIVLGISSGYLGRALFRRQWIRLTLISKAYAEGPRFVYSTSESKTPRNHLVITVVPPEYVSTALQVPIASRVVAIDAPVQNRVMIATSGANR
jgi:hypothetical protein